jgi:glutaredoxin
MWDHRNSVNNEAETATMSIKINRKIREEYNQGFGQGFGNLSSAAINLAKQSEGLLKEKGLNYRKQWLRTFTAHREFQERQKSKNQAPRVILDGKGHDGSRTASRSTEKWALETTRRTNN